jgi:Fic family protein
MAVAHYQFEAIHPFTDGNGRTGRILNQLMLVEHGLLDTPVMYLSRYFIQHKADYYRLLLAVTKSSAWEEWIRYVLEGVRETATWTSGKVEAIRALLGDTADYIRAKAPKTYSRELVELTFVQPYCRIQNVVDAGLGNRQTAASYLKTLAGIDVLKEVKVGREKLFIHPKLVRLLTSESHTYAPYPGRQRTSPTGKKIPKQKPTTFSRKA